MGHYYAYSKNDEDKLWYEFNDTSVWQIKSIDDVKIFKNYIFLIFGLFSASMPFIFNIK